MEKSTTTILHFLGQSSGSSGGQSFTIGQVIIHAANQAD